MTKLTHTRPAQPPTWDEYWADDWSSRWLTVKALIELSPKYVEHFSRYLDWEDGESHLDWYAACVSADSLDASSTERRLVNLVASFVQPESYLSRGDDQRDIVRRVDVGSLEFLGSWQHQAAIIMFRWMTGTVTRSRAGVSASESGSLGYLAGATDFCARDDVVCPRGEWPCH